MDKAFLKEIGPKLGASGLALEGVARLESLRTLYRFVDGECIEVERRRDCAPIDARLVGMRLVGWIMDNRVLVPAWRQGARGVLWRASGGGGTVALTSASFAFVRDLAPIGARMQPPPARPALQSQTRVIEPKARLSA